MFDSTTLEISRSAYANNIKQIRELAGDSIICPVFKGNAYGHGLELMVGLAMDNQITDFAVFSAEEAYRAKSVCGSDGHIMIMGMIPDDALEWAISEEVSCYVFNLERLQKILEAARKTGRKARIHLEVETGMNRTGLEKEPFKKALTIIRQNTDTLDYRGICSHLAGAESIGNYYRIQHQIKRFKELIKLNLKSGPAPSLIHAACSAAMIRYPGTRYDLVRVGILQYGFFPSPEIFIEYTKRTGNFDNPFKRLIRWTSQVMDVKHVNMGDYIGYGTGFLSSSNMKVAAIPVGYAHGYNRSLSNQGSVLVRGRRLNVVGLVNMNMLLVDATDLDDVCIGDEAVLIGRQDDAEISVASFSEISNQVDYELLTRLNSTIPRVLVD
jgi:alanine racemase